MTQQNLFELKPKGMSFREFLDALSREIGIMENNAFFEQANPSSPGAWWDCILTFIAAGGSELRGWAEAEVRRKIGE